MIQYAILTAVRAITIGSQAFQPGDRILGVKGHPDAVAHLRANLRWSACRVDLGSIVEAPTSPAEGVDLRARIADLEAECNGLRAELADLANAGRDAQLKAEPDVLVEVPAELLLGQAIVGVSDELLIDAPGIGAKNVKHIKAWAADLVAQHPAIVSPFDRLADSAATATAQPSQAD